MEVATKEKLKPRKIFMKCGACSHAMFHILNLTNNNEKLPEEKASDLLAGGIALKGYQCGMLWGAALGAGAEANKRYKDKDDIIASAIVASRELLESFQRRTGTVNCREITKADFNKKFDNFLFMVKTISMGFIYSPCFNLLVKWTPEAISAANLGFENMRSSIPGGCMSCATEVLRAKGASEEEALLVAGFAGGIGLSGHACGALSAAIWYEMLQWNKKNPDKTPSMYHNKEAERILAAFLNQTNNKMLCSSITSRTFESVEEHTDYLRGGGCQEVIGALANA